MRLATCLLAVLLLTVPAGAMAQPMLIAHYPLSSDALDATGNNDPIILQNAPFQDGGVLCNGEYVNSGSPDAYEVRTPILPSFNFAAFTISAEFKISEYPEDLPPGRVDNRPVFVGGSSARWIGVEITKEGNYVLLYNNSNRVVSDQIVSLNEWHTAAVSYNSVDGQATLYLDDQLILTASFDINTSFGDRNIMTHNGSVGRSFKGIFRQLKVYDTDAPVPTSSSTWGSVKTLYR